MNKLDMKTLDNSAYNVVKIGQLFPNVITEKEDETGQKVKAIDFELLRQLLSDEIVEDENERYRLDWPGKKASLLKANTPITKTLRPDRESSINFDTTQNVYIEGDNFEVLKILQESYLNKIKMIYIDPPYNTGKDFVYKDTFKVSKDEYEEELGVEDEEGGKLFKNTDTNGRFHSDWLSMMYERLVIARDMLRDDGIIFISIDDNEIHNLRNICNDIFGEDNFIATIIWEKSYSPINLKKHFSNSHDYVVCYAKKIENAINNGLPRSVEADNRYSNPDNDPRGPWKPATMSVGPVVESQVYKITTPTGREIFPPSNYCWMFKERRYIELLNDNRIWFGPDGGSVPSLKRFLSEVKSTITPTTLWKYTEVGHSQDAMRDLKQIFDEKVVFDYPKTVALLMKMLVLYTNSKSGDIVLDFFSGSSTTAHAVMQLNAEDAGNRKFIMVQIPEQTDEKSEAHKYGYKTISEIGKERIRRAGKKILVEKSEKLAQRETPLDIGFRVYKTDSTVVEDVFYHPSELDQNSLTGIEDNIKSDRTSEDVFTQVILDLGLTLDLPIERKDIKGHTVFFVADNALAACFDKNISFDVIDEIIKIKPLKVVFRDASFVDDKDRINLETKFKQGSPETSISVL